MGEDEGGGGELDVGGEGGMEGEGGDGGVVERDGDGGRHHTRIDR